MSRFVDALKTELEATFKEDISIYFDENPHDRLQETHNVDKSLEGKLKCLIFIPILSQTYCDPNSYAWQYEFLAFIKMAENDRLGKDVKLRSGNVTSRIFPVRIHDLEPEDVKLFEKETGGMLRALDKAEEHYRHALQLSPSWTVAMNNLAFLLIYYEMNVDEGMKLINRALELSPGNPDLLHTLGLGYYKQGKYAEALSRLEVVKDSSLAISLNLDQQIQEVKNALANQKKN